MGIFIHLALSSAITPSEWQAAYQESLTLVKAFALAELRQKEIAGIPVFCLTSTEERTQPITWKENGSWTGWTVNGDLLTLRTAEEYWLPRDLADELSFDPAGGDAALSYAVQSLFRSEEVPAVPAARHLWGGKTQGEPYHMALLAIACLLADRLGHKVYVYGDITLGQCRRAVTMANQVLDTPIAMPDLCDRQRWYQRVQAWPLSGPQKLCVFEERYLGEKDIEFGAFLRQNFAEAVCREYWRERFRDGGLHTVSFETNVQQYLLWGFDLRELCGLAAFAAKDGEAYGETLVEAVMDTGVYLTVSESQGDGADFAIDPQAEAPYGVGRLLLQFLFGSARNRYIDRYIPLEQVRAALAAGLHGVCDTDAVIDRYLADKAAPKEPQQAGGLRAKLLARRDAWQKDAAQYDILHSEQLLGYHDGDRIHPDVERNLRQFRPFFRSLPTGQAYQDLMKQPIQQRCRWLADNNRHLILRDSDWSHIFEQVNQTPAAFARYYPMGRLELNSDDAIEIMRSLVLNDVLYAFFLTMPEDAEP